MHETSLATRVVATAVREARRRALKQVRTVRVRLGALWGIEPASFLLEVSLSCSECGASGVTIEQGRELEVVAVEG